VGRAREESGHGWHKRDDRPSRWLGGDVELAEEYPDLDTFLRGYLAAGLIVGAIRTLGEQSVRDALTEGVRPLMTTAGGVRFEDEYRYLIATS
jgi:hypothetical protein